MRKQRGISLVELMVSITIGLILMTGVVQLFLSSRATFATQQALSRVQETGRLAMEFLAQDVRMAGFMGCMSRHMSFTNTLNQSNTLAFNFSVAIEGLDNVGNTVPAGYPAGIVAETDVLVVRSANDNAVGVIANNSSAQLFVANTGVGSGDCSGGVNSLSGICPGDILVVSDCQKARVFQGDTLTATGSASNGNAAVNITHNASGTPGNAISSWGGSSIDPSENFGPSSEIIRINTLVYYIADLDGDGINSLYRRSGTAAAVELLRGVQDMQIQYGRDTDDDGIPDSYVDGSTAPAFDWSQVMSARIQLLVQSVEDNVLAEAQPYIFPLDAGAPTPSPDRRLRQVFVNTIGIRSRLP